MGLFVIVCGLVIVAALAAESGSERGILIIPPAVWYAILGVLGIWLVLLVE